MKEIIILSFAFFTLAAGLVIRDTAPLNRKCGCKFEDKPVCGVMPDGSRQDFENPCKAGCGGAVNHEPGHCSHSEGHSLCGCPPFGDEVCGKMSDGSRKEFDNKCWAVCAGARHIRNGKCRGGSDSDSSEDSSHNQDHTELPPLCGCPPFGSPACGTMSDGSMRDFDNKCEASCAGAHDITEGQCNHDLPPLPPLCGCQPIDDPVCGKMADGSMRDFENRCEAGCGGATSISNGHCLGDLPPPCGCPPYGTPVCGTMADGSTKDFSNKCEAGCGGATDVTDGFCDSGIQVDPIPPTRLCGCPPIDEPVCGTMPDGSEQDFMNHCQAGCSDATNITPGQCSGDLNPPTRLCGCPPIEDPVCGKMPDGSNQDFSNRCQAGCADATDIRPGSCSEQQKLCLCNKMLLPACGTMPDGSRRDFSNPCMAGCEGATDISVGACSGEEDIVPITILCGCPPHDEPVCGKMSDGTMQDFPNHCEAGCKDAKDIVDGHCDSNHEEPLTRKCGCPFIDAPVCGTVADGSKQDFPNSCVAGCSDATEITDGRCSDEDKIISVRLCGCKPHDEPVCGRMPDGSLMTFPNQCQAGCKDATDITSGECNQES